MKERFIYSLLWLALSVFATTEAFAQQPASPFGTHFVVAFPDTITHFVTQSMQTPRQPTQCSVIVYARERTAVRLRSRQGNLDFTVGPGSPYILNVSPSFVSHLNAISTNVFDIQSDKAVMLYCYYTTAYGSEAFTPLPVTSWGTEYFAMSYPAEEVAEIDYNRNEEEFTFRIAPPELVIVASRKSHVTVRNRRRLVNPVIWDGVLEGGEAYLVQFNADVPESELDGRLLEFDGLSVTSDHPVGVISGNPRVIGQWEAIMYPLANPAQNSAVEWLAPVDAHGTEFVYRTIAPRELERTREIVQLVATSPGVTAVQGMPGVPGTVYLEQGEVLKADKLFHRELDAVGVHQIRTDKPAQAAVLTGVRIDRRDNGVTAIVWGPAMAELLPPHRWIMSGRFYSPGFPASLEHYVVIVADAGARVLLDGQQVVFQGATADDRFYHARIPVQPGDHSITSFGGAFSAVAYGTADGFQEYRPLSPGLADDPFAGSVSLPHPSVYSERASVTYAYPVGGIGETISDSVNISEIIACDSSEFFIEYAENRDAWGVLAAEVAPGAENMKAELIPIIRENRVAGFRIVCRPANPALDARGKVVVRSTNGRQWEFPFRYVAEFMSIAPNTLEIEAGLPSVAAIDSLEITNRALVPLTITSIQLRNPSLGFTLLEPTAFPIVLQPGESIWVKIAFQGETNGNTIPNILDISTDCRSAAIRLVATAGRRPAITGHDWKDRWLSGDNICTKNDTIAYDAAVRIGNDGLVPFTVRSLELIGDDATAGIFTLGSPAAVSPGDVLQSGEERQQSVRFRPMEERAYSCTIRLITMDDDTVTAQLLGRGVESHVGIGGYDFGTTEVLSAGQLRIPGTARLAARPTRPLTVMGLRIAGADAADFGFDPAFTVPDPLQPATWWTLAPGEEREIPLVFAPGTFGEKNAWIEAIGDHSRCDDSLAPLKGTTFQREIRDYDFGVMQGCTDSLGVIHFANTGGSPFIVTAITVDDATGAFTVAVPGLPLRLQAGEDLLVPVRFHPQGEGEFTGRLLFVIEPDGGAGDRDTVIATLRGAARPVQVRAHIARDHRATPGNPLRVPVVLDELLDQMKVDHLEFTLNYGRLILRLHNGSSATGASMLAGTLLDGWNMTVLESREGLFRARFQSPARGYLRGTGTLLMLEFNAYLSDSLETELPFTLKAPDRECTEIEALPGLVRLDSICGLNSRLIELVGGMYSLEGNRPNPFNPSTDIEVVLGLEGATRLEVYDGAGLRVAVMDAGILPAGRHLLRWDARRMASGVYRYRVISGEWQSDIRTMVLVK